MKTIVIVLSFFVVFASAIHAQTRTQKRMLVTYFSFPEKGGTDASTGASRIIAEDQLYGTTEYVAKVVAAATGAATFPIKTVHTYPNETHKELIDYAKQESDSKTFPKIASAIENFADYNVIFVGYPNWWYDMPRVIHTLFREYDFSGKTIVPFCTHGGSGFSGSIRSIEALEPKAEVIGMPAIPARNAASSREGVVRWLTENGFVNK